MIVFAAKVSVRKIVVGVLAAILLYEAVRQRIGEEQHG